MGEAPHIGTFCWGKKLHSILEEAVYQLSIDKKQEK